MKTYFISGDLHDNYEEFNCIGPFSRLVVAPNAKSAWEDVISEIESAGGLAIIKEIKVVE